MFFSKKHTVYVKNRDISFEVRSGKNLFEALEENGIVLASLCHGSGQCGKCKVKIEANHINKSTRLERHSLSEMSISMGVRLACEYSIKSDIVVDTEELHRRNNEDPCVISVRTIEPTEKDASSHKSPITDKDEDENEFKSAISYNIFTPHDETEDNSDEPEDSEEEQSSDDSIENDEPIIVKYEEETPLEKETVQNDTDYSTDGLLLIQTPGGITYFYYSAGIAGISAKDFIPTDRTLAELLRQGEVKKFLDRYLPYKGYERAILILSEKHFEGENIFGLINYCSFSNDNLFCEVIQPQSTPKDILRFFRFLNQSTGRKMIIPLDCLDKIYFYNNGTIIGMDAFIKSNFLMEYIGGKNPVSKISDDLMSYESKNNDFPPDSISLSVLFKTAALLHGKKLLSKQFKLADKMSLVGDGLEGGHHIRLIAKFSGNAFKIDSGHDILIPQKTFDELFALRSFLHTCIKYAEKRCGKPDSIIFYSLFPIKELAESIIALEMLPKRYNDVIRTFSEDPTLFAINFFQQPTVLSYIEATLKMGEDISMNDDIFAGIYEKINEEFKESE